MRLMHVVRAWDEWFDEPDEPDRVENALDARPRDSREKFHQRRRILDRAMASRADLVSRRDRETTLNGIWWSSSSNAQMYQDTQTSFSTTLVKMSQPLRTVEECHESAISTESPSSCSSVITTRHTFTPDMPVAAPDSPWTGPCWLDICLGGLPA